MKWANVKRLNTTQLSFPLLLLLALLCLTGCGFHLRGEAGFAPPLTSIYLKTNDPYGQLSRNLQNYLSMSNALATHQKDASVTLHLLGESTHEQLLSVSGTQQTRQYNLYLSVHFQLEDSNDNVIVPPETLTESRTLTLESSQILGSTNEASMLYQQMRGAIVYDIINRITSQDIISQLTERHLTHEAAVSTTGNASQ